MTTVKKVVVYVIAILALSAVGLGIGCASFSQYITPATRDQRAIDYVVESGVADANEYDGYFNLEKAFRLEIDVIAAKNVKDLIIKHMYEQNELTYNQIKQVVTRNLEAAQAREDFFFNEKTGLFSVGLTAIGFGTLTGMIGLLRKRPQDITPEELQEKTAGFRQELGIKEQQFSQVVTGVEKFLQNKKVLVPILSDSNIPALEKVDAVLAVLKTCLSKEQDKSTQQEVAKVKATV